MREYNEQQQQLIQLYLLANEGLLDEDGQDAGVDEHGAEAGHHPL
jgi:hypothetical protein